VSQPNPIRASSQPGGAIGDVSNADAAPYPEYFPASRYRAIQISNGTAGLSLNAAVAAGEYYASGVAVATGEARGQMLPLVISEWTRLRLRVVLTTNGTDATEGLTVALKKVLSIAGSGNLHVATLSAALLSVVVPALAPNAIDVIRTSTLSDLSALTDGLYAITGTIASPVPAGASLGATIRFSGAPPTG
jgi:hypothetical protein